MIRGIYPLFKMSRCQFDRICLYVRKTSLSCLTQGLQVCWLETSGYPQMFLFVCLFLSWPVRGVILSKGEHQETGFNFEVMLRKQNKTKQNSTLHYGVKRLFENYYRLSYFSSKINCVLPLLQYWNKLIALICVDQCNLRTLTSALRHKGNLK